MSGSTCAWTGGGDNKLGRRGQRLLWWPLEMACNPPRKVKNQIRRVRGITNRPPTPLQADHKGCRSTRSGVCLIRTGWGGGDLQRQGLTPYPPYLIWWPSCPRLLLIRCNLLPCSNHNMGGCEFGIWEPPLHFLDDQMNEWMNEWSEGLTKEEMGLYDGWNWKREQSRATVKNAAKWNHKSPIVQTEVMCLVFRVRQTCATRFRTLGISVTR